MAYRITQSEDAKDDKLVLRLEGSFNSEGALKLEQICDDAQKHLRGNITIDVSEITFLDESASAILCRLKKRPGISLIGCRLFTKKVMDQSEMK